MRGFRPLWCCLLVGAMLAAPAQANAGRWSPPSDLATGVAGADVEILRDGTALTILGFSDPEYDASVPTYYDHGWVSASTRPPGGVFGAPVRLTPKDRHLTNVFTNFGLDAALLFDATDPHGRHVVPTLLPRPDGGDFQDPEPLPDSDAWAYGTLDEDGNLTLVRVPVSGEKPWLVTRSRDGTYGPKRTIDIPGWNGAGDPVVAAGGSTTLFSRAGKAGSEIVSATAPPGGDLGLSQTIATGQHATYPNEWVAHDARGDAVVIWNANAKDGPWEFGSIHTAFRPAGGPAEQPKDIPGDPIERVQYLSLAMNARGDAAIVWGDMLGQTALTYRPAGGNWEHATAGPPGPGNSTNYPVVAIGANGDATAVYSNEGPTLRAVDHPAGHPWQRPELVFKEKVQGLDADVAVDPHGNATAVWRWFGDNAHQGVRAATHQIAPLPPEGDERPVVTDFKLRKGKSTKFAYKVSEKGRVEIALRRSKRVLAVIRAKAKRGSNHTGLPRKVSKKLGRKASYRASIVAVDRYGQYSKPRTLEFER